MSDCGTAAGNRMLIVHDVVYSGVPEVKQLVKRSLRVGDNKWLIVVDINDLIGVDLMGLKSNP